MDNSNTPDRTLILYFDENERIIASTIKQVIALFDSEPTTETYQNILNPPKEIKRYDYVRGSEWILGENINDKLFSYDRYIFIMLSAQSASLALWALTLRGSADKLKGKSIVFIDPEKHISDTGLFNISEIFDKENRITGEINNHIRDKLKADKLDSLFQSLMNEVSHDNRKSA